MAGDSRSWLGAIPALLGIGVPTMMQVGPDDAILNFCKWPRKFVTVPENCLPGATAHELYLLAVLLVSISLLWFGRPYLKRTVGRARMIIGILILCCGCGIGVFGLSIIAGGGESNAQGIGNATTSTPSAGANVNDKPPTPQAIISGNNNVVSLNQSGGQTAHTIINQAPDPQLHSLGQERRQNQDGTYDNILMIQVVSPYPPAMLNLDIFAPNLVKVDILPQDTNMVMSGPSGMRDGNYFTRITQPIGRYRITVRTSQFIAPRDIRVDYNWGN